MKVRLLSFAIFLILALLVSQAWAINVRVREVRRSSLDQEVAFVYEVENASIDRVRFQGVEAHFFDEKGRRVELLRPYLELNPMKPGDVAFLRMRIGMDVMAFVSDLHLRFYAYEDPPVPLLKPQVRALTFEFPVKKGAGPRFDKSGLRLKGLGFVESRARPKVLLLYSLRNEGNSLYNVILEFSFFRDGRLLDSQTHSLPDLLKKGEEAYIQVRLPKEKALLINRVDVKANYFEEMDFRSKDGRREIRLEVEREKPDGERVPGLIEAKLDHF